MTAQQRDMVGPDSASARSISAGDVAASAPSFERIRLRSPCGRASA